MPRGTHVAMFHPALVSSSLVAVGLMPHRGKPSGIGQYRPCPLLCFVPCSQPLSPLCLLPLTPDFHAHQSRGSLVPY